MKIEIRNIPVLLNENEISRNIKNSEYIYTVEPLLTDTPIKRTPI